MAARLRFGILGPLEVRRDTALVRVGGPKQRALLALLLCRANRVVSRDQLIDELLADQPAGTADRILRVQVSRLRKALAEPDSEPRVLAQPPGYLLRVGDGELDLHEYEQQVTAGRQALSSGAPQRAAVLLRQAESLWRGPPLADLDDPASVAQLEVQRLHTLRLQAIEDQIEAELTIGRHTALCPELERLVAEHPLRERFRAQLMLALYRCGRQADALETYRAARSLLIEELAVEPGPQLRQLHRAVLEHDAALDPPDPPELTDRPGPPAVPAAPHGPESGTPRPARRHRQVHRVVVAASVAAILAALAAFVPLSRHGTAAVATNANLLALVSYGDGTVRATVPLRAPPADLAAGSGSLWVTQPDAGLVTRVDPQRRTVTATIPVGTKPDRVLAAGGQVWVLDRQDRTLSRIDPRTDTVTQTIALGRPPGDVLLSAGVLWVTSPGAGTVLRISPATGRTLGQISTGGHPGALAGAAGAVWAADSATGRVTRIDTGTGRVTGTVRVGDGPTAMAADATGLWVLDPLDATVARVDSRPDAVAMTVAFIWQRWRNCPSS